MKKKTLLTIALGIMSLSAVQAKNFWLKFDGQSISAEKSQQQISSWFSLPAETSFELLKDYVDNLGYRHQIYQQYVAGVLVDGGIVKVHSLDGQITSANGNLVELPQAPKRIQRIGSTDAKIVDGVDMVIVEVKDGVHYARKSYDIINNEDVYTDVDTGEELKRLSRRYSADVLTSGQSLYSGTCDFMINQAADGTYILNDSTRHIYTLDARVASPGTAKFRDKTFEEGFNVGKYVLANTIPLANPDKNWSLLRVDSILVDSLGKSLNNYWSLNTSLLHKDIYGVYQLHGKAFSKNEELPLKLDVTNLYAEANYPSYFNIEWVEGEDKYINLSDTIECLANEPGVYQWKAVDANGVTRARGRYFVSRMAHFAVDVQWGMEQTYDFYKDVFKRDSYDGEGAPIYNVVYPIYVNYALDKPVLVFTPGNAAAQMTKSFCYMVYGIGSNTRYPMVSLDFMAHEFTHMMTFKTSNLEYEGETGALNESFSDIVGITIKQKAKKCPDNWLMGDELVVDPTERCIRDMQNPDSKQHASMYEGSNWMDPTSKLDYGGVHCNSGVQNRWYYLLVNGGSYLDDKGINHSFEGIGVDKAIQIAFRNVSEILTSKAQYKDAVIGSVQAAEELYGKESVEAQTVIDAWATVGLGNVISTGIANAVSASPKVGNAGIYRLDGMKINSTSTTNLAPGIYIKNGKKIVVGLAK